MIRTGLCCTLCYGHVRLTKNKVGSCSDFFSPGISTLSHGCESGATDLQSTCLQVLHVVAVSRYWVAAKELEFNDHNPAL